jgi:hypothetical protein
VVIPAATLDALRLIVLIEEATREEMSSELIFIVDVIFPICAVDTTDVDIVIPVILAVEAKREMKL